MLRDRLLKCEVRACADLESKLAPGRSGGHRLIDQLCAAAFHLEQGMPQASFVCTLTAALVSLDNDVTAGKPRPSDDVLAGPFCACST